MCLPVRQTISLTRFRATRRAEKTARIWPRDSFEAPVTNDACLVENKERLCRVIRKRKLRFDVDDAVIRSCSLSFREDLTLPSLGSRLYAKPTQRHRFTTSCATDAWAASVGGPRRGERCADDRTGASARRPTRYGRRTWSLTVRMFGHRRVDSTSRHRDETSNITGSCWLEAVVTLWRSASCTCVFAMLRVSCLFQYSSRRVPVSRRIRWPPKNSDDYRHHCPLLLFH